MSRPTVVTRTVATSPLSTREAVPVPVTWLVGTGLVAAASCNPGDAVEPFPAAEVLADVAEPAVLGALEEEPEVPTTTATIAAATSRAASAGQRYFLTPPPGEPDPGPLGGPDGGAGGVPEVTPAPP